MLIAFKSRHNFSQYNRQIIVNNYTADFMHLQKISTKYRTVKISISRDTTKIKISKKLFEWEQLRGRYYSERSWKVKNESYKVLKQLTELFVPLCILNVILEGTGTIRA